jgi:hypothetical protein
MGVPVLSDDVLRVGKATKEDSEQNPRLVDIPDLGKEFVGKARSGTTSWPRLNSNSKRTTRRSIWVRSAGESWLKPSSG